MSAEEATKCFFHISRVYNNLVFFQILSRLKVFFFRFDLKSNFIIIACRLPEKERKYFLPPTSGKRCFPETFNQKLCLIELSSRLLENRNLEGLINQSEKDLKLEAACLVIWSMIRQGQ